MNERFVAVSTVTGSRIGIGLCGCSSKPRRVSVSRRGGFKLNISLKRRVDNKMDQHGWYEPLGWVK